MFSKRILARVSTKLPDHPSGGDLEESIRLCTKNMGLISSMDDVKVPAYDRSSITPGVVNLGLRNFHRVHNANYFDQLLSVKGNAGWGMISVGTTESHRRVRDALKMQNSLYTVISKDPSGESDIRVYGSILDVFQAPDDTNRVIDLIASPTTKMVTLTIKEANYHMNDSFTDLQVDNPQVIYDTVTATVPSRPPRTPIGILVNALYKRYKIKGSPPITILCCDNLIRGGEITRRVVEQLALHRFPTDTGFHQWLGANVFYPNSMCDRICLTDPLDDSVALQQKFGIRDSALLTTERYSDWVIEKWMGEKPEGMADGVAGIKLVASTLPYENLKIRLNYGTRLSVAMVASGLGYAKFEEALRNPAVAKFMTDYMNEVEPGLSVTDPVLISQVKEYKKHLLERISTKQLKYICRRVIEDSSKKIRMDWQPVLESLPEKASTKRIAFAIAVWTHLLSSSGASRSVEIPLIDVNMSQLEPLAKALIGSVQASSADNHSVNTAANDILHCMFGAKFNIDKNELRNNVVSALKSIRDNGSIEAALHKL